MLRFVYLSVLLVGVSSDQRSYSAALDRLLAQSDKLLKRQQFSTYQLKEIDKPFNFELVEKPLNGEFWAQKGQARGLASLIRASEVTVDEDGSKITLSSEFTFYSLSFNYDYFRFYYLTLDVNGKLKIRFPSLRGTIQVATTKNGSGCTAELQKAKIYYLGPPKVITRGGKVPVQYHWTMVKFVLQSYHTEGSEAVRLRTIDALTEAVKLVDFC